MMNLLKSVFGGAGNSQLNAVLEQGAVIIDVRSPGEFAGGHSQGAINIPLDQLGSKVAKLKSYKKPIVVCCASGMRSARAKSLLSSQGVTDLYDAGSWRNLK
ncbi:rhodanese-like domain-containing protein [Spirosoma sp.]|uniref:rhodanese-like domain-containing protein n=1 Tax=Spirosoma sp. TaxID=1899569 RepID=UPI00261958EB|nr:rhodanese-like domain-containing protein [Spirosoma sp.]MCX6216798.1 rhodanese-like domain-containing protein [Spirosoma sp.]